MAENKLESIVVGGVEYKFTSNCEISSIIPEISHNSCSTENDEIEITSDDGSETYAKLTKMYLQVKSVYDFDGNLIAGNIAPIEKEPFIGNYIYTVANNLGIRNNSAGYLHRNYSAVLQVERLFNFDTSKQIPKIRFDNGKLVKEIFSPFSGYGGTINSETTISGVTEISSVEIPRTISFNGVNNKLEFIHRSSLASSGRGSQVRLLCIGDSITNLSGADYGTHTYGDASVYWSWIAKMFYMDCIDDNTNDFDFIAVGCNSEETFSFTYKNKSKTIHACAEGRSGYQTTEYHHSKWRRDLTGRYAGYNFFYDLDTNDECKFSLNAYLAHYRTLSDTGERLELGDPSLGTRIVSNIPSECDDPDVINESERNYYYRLIDKNYNVCTPTHIIIQLGTNNGSDYISAVYHLKDIISKIRQEGYNIPIALTYPGNGGCYYPEEYPETDEYNSKFNNTHPQNAENYIKAYNQLAEELNSSLGNVYFISNYTVQPCPHSEERVINHPEILLGDLNGKYGITWGNQPQTHPDIYAHVNWAYQFYSWIKWTLRS